MEKRRNKRERKHKAPALVPLRIRKHIQALGMRNSDQYLAWCRAHGFDASLDKDERDRFREEEKHRTGLAPDEPRLRTVRKPAALLEAICNGEPVTAARSLRGWHRVCDAIRESDDSTGARESLLSLLLEVERKGKWIADCDLVTSRRYPYIRALIALNDRRSQWIRSPDSWTVRSRNRGRQFSSLARHLLARRNVPHFMDAAWFRGDRDSERWRDWFVRLGVGDARTIDSPLPLTRRIVRHFLEAPGDYSIEGALQWGRVHALGGDRRLAEALIGSRVGNSFDEHEFWNSVVQFFVENPMLDRHQFAPIVDFLQYQKFDERNVQVTGRGVVRRGPPQPNLSMKGRTAGALLRQVEKWHDELGRGGAARNLVFARSPIRDYVQSAGREGADRWSVRQILTGAGLIAEGRAMRHCVASYASSCSRGLSSIWAMELETRAGVEKRLTVELNQHGVIRQALGKYNRRPMGGELEVLRRWALAEELTISRSIGKL